MPEIDPWIEVPAKRSIGASARQKSFSYHRKPLSDELKAMVDVGPRAFDEADLDSTFWSRLAVSLLLHAQETSVLVQLAELDRTLCRLLERVDVVASNTDKLACSN